MYCIAALNSFEIWSLRACANDFAAMDLPFVSALPPRR
jgi:hypothetical protein